MNMEVRDGFAGVRSVIHDQAKPMGELKFFCDRAGDEQEMTQDGLVGGRRFTDARYHFLGHNQKMHGCLRLNVVQYHAVFILMFNAGGNFASDDFFEERFHGAGKKPG